MAQCVISGVEISGITATVPGNIAANINFDFIPLKDREKLIKTTGIEQRRVTDSETCTSDLCFHSAQKLIEGLNWDKSEIEVLILITQTPDYVFPMTSILLQDKLGLHKSCICMDISLGCSGYVYGLSVISSLMTAMGLKKGILLTGDTISKTASATDKSTYPLFGDAGTATALKKNPGALPMYFDLQNDGAGYKAIIIPDGGYRNPFHKGSLDVQEFDQGVSRNNCNLILEGVDVFNFSIREVAPSVKSVLSFANKTDDDIDYYIFHQANMMMNELIRKKLSIASEKVPYSLKEFGNTSSATIPLTIVSQIANVFNEGVGKSLVLSGFGVGLSWGSAVVNIGDAYIPAVFEYENIKND